LEYVRSAFTSGPQKGYIDELETRVHRFEAIIGALLLAAPNDARASTLLDDLRAVDGMARGVIDQVDGGLFGPAARGVKDGARELGAMRSGSASQGARINVSIPDGLFHHALTSLT